MKSRKRVVKIISPATIPAFLREQSDDDYAMLVVANSRRDIDSLKDHLDGLINKHCIYFVCAGPLAEEMFDMIEATIASLELDGKIPETSDMISTVWYDHRHAGEIAGRFLRLANPATSLYLVALLGADPFSRSLKAGLP